MSFPRKSLQTLHTHLRNCHFTWMTATMRVHLDYSSFTVSGMIGYFCKIEYTHHPVQVTRTKAYCNYSREYTSCAALSELEIGGLNTILWNCIFSCTGCDRNHNCCVCNRNFLRLCCKLANQL